MEQRADEDTDALMDEFTRWVALGLVNLSHAVDPKVFVIGGGGGRALGSGLELVRHFFADLIYQSQQRELPRILQAKLGEYAGAVGAALLTDWRGDFVSRAERG